MAKRDREIRFKWNLTESSVWNERMLEALEKGVQVGV